MGGVHCVGTVYTAGRNDADRRLLVFHGVNLDGTGLGTEKNLVGDVEGVLRVACRMKFRRVERGEVVVVGFDLRAFGDGEAHAEENVLELGLNLGERMQPADFELCGRKRHVECFGLDLLLRFKLGDMVFCLFKGLLDGGTNAVAELADDRTFFGGKLCHAL